MAWLAGPLKVGLVVEQTLVSAMLVDVLARCDDVVHYRAQRLCWAAWCVWAKRAERIPGQYHTAHSAPQLRLVELTDRVIDAAGIELLTLLHLVDRIGPKGSSWQVLPASSERN